MGRQHDITPDPLADGNIDGQNPATPERLPGHTSGVESQFGAAAHSIEDLRGRPAFLYESGPLRAVSLTSDSSALPAAAGGGTWRLSGYLTLGEPDPALADMGPEMVLEAVAAHAHCIWRRQGPV